MKSTNDGPRKAKRVVRPLSVGEMRRLERARKETAAERDAIVQRGKKAKKAWLATRLAVDGIVRRLREERQRQGLTLADVEVRSGLRKAVLSRLENDVQANPTILTLQRYATALGLTVWTTVSGSENGE